MTILPVFEKLVVCGERSVSEERPGAGRAAGSEICADGPAGGTGRCHSDGTVQRAEEVPEGYWYLP